VFLLISLSTISGKYFLPHLSLYTDCYLVCDSFVRSLSAAGSGCTPTGEIPGERRLVGPRCPTPCPQQAQLWGQTRLIKVLPGGGSKTPQSWRQHNVPASWTRSRSVLEGKTLLLISRPSRWCFLLSPLCHPLATYCCEKPCSLMTTSQVPGGCVIGGVFWIL